MSWSPISLIMIQYQNPSDNTPYSGAVLKAYAAGTTTNISLATDSSGGTTFTSIALNASGYPEHSGSIVIPHADQNYKLALYANQAAADADTPAIWSIDDNVPVNITNDFTLEDNVSNAASVVSNFTHTTTGTPVAGIGTALGFTTETSAGNNELGMQLQSVATDVSGGSEDFKFRVQLMAGGATATNVFEVDSAALMKFLLPNPQILGGDTDGTFYLGAGATNVLGSGVTFYGDTHATKAGDIELMQDGAVKMSYNLSTTLWNITQDFSVTGTATFPTPVLGGVTFPTSDGSANQVIRTDGAGAATWQESTSNINSQTFTSSGTWTKPSGVDNVYYILVGGGGGGGGGSSTTNGGGGGGGQVKFGWTAVSDDITVTIGAGGAGNSASSGSAGSSSTFATGASVTAVGGGGGGSSNPSAVAGNIGGYGNSLGAGGGGGSGAAGGPAQNPTTTTAPVFPTSSGNTGGFGSTTTAVSGAGGKGTLGYGGGGGGGAASSNGAGLDGGGAGGAAGAGTAGTDNTGGGGGGSGEDGVGNLAGGAGGSGVAIIYWWT